MNPTRRSLLGAAAAAGALIGGTGPALGAAGSVPSFVDAIVDLSRDAKGQVHVERVALVGPTGASGTLPLSDDEIADLQGTLAGGDFTVWQQRGLRADGRKFVFVKHDDQGMVVHAVRPGEFLTLRVDADRIVMATSGPGMAHGRAVEAVYQFCRRAPVA